MAWVGFWPISLVFVCLMVGFPVLVAQCFCGFLDDLFFFFFLFSCGGVGGPIFWNFVSATPASFVA